MATTTIPELVQRHITLIGFAMMAAVLLYVRRVRAG
jgi:hypothetical protein